MILVEEETDRLAVERFNKEMETARKGMALSVTHPSKLDPRLEGGDVKWMSRAKGGLNPSRLDYDIYQEVSRFFKKDEEGGVLLLLGLEYLSVVNGFKMVAKVLKKIGDRASSSGGALIVDMNPMASMVVAFERNVAAPRPPNTAPVNAPPPKAPARPSPLEDCIKTAIISANETMT